MAFVWTALLATPLVTALAGCGALYALHYLRSKPPRREMETLLFWDPADLHPTARLLWARRLRQWFSLLLLCLFVLLFAAALAIARWESWHGPAAIVVIDAGSAAADAGGKSLLPALRDAAFEAMSGRRAVVIAAAEQPRIIADANDAAAMARWRLADLCPSQTAPASALSLELAASITGTGDAPIDWFTPQASLPDELPAAIAHRVRRHWIKQGENQWAITSIQFHTSADDPKDGSVTVTAAGSTNDSSATIHIASDPGGQQTAHAIRGAGRLLQAVFSGVPSDGRRLQVAVVDDHSHGVVAQSVFTVPRESAPRFFGIENAPAPLRAALLSFGQQTHQPQGAIAVRMAGMPAPAGAIGLIEIVPDNTSGAPSPLKIQDVMLTRGLGFQGAEAAVGNPATPGERVVLCAGEHPVIALSDSGARPIIYVQASVLSADAELPRLPAFPILFRRLCGIVGGAKGSSPLVLSQRHVDDPLWPGGDANAVCEVDSPPDNREGSASGEIIKPSGWHAAWNVAEWLLCIGVGLLVLDAALLRAGKIA